MAEKKSKKGHRASRALFELIELYLKTGRPVGSEALKESGFAEISSATLRNYFADFRERGPSDPAPHLRRPHPHPESLPALC